MKPIKLVMKNFGPFLDETIDFNNLNGHSLFLISGRTGSGKTMLFDAMTYALFGEGSSSSRKSSDMRSHFAEGSQPTIVTFEFSVQGEKYKVRRQPSYVPSGYKSAKQPEFELSRYIDGEEVLISAKSQEGTKKVSEIIKMDVNQFRQILILPQGEFKKFLVSGTKDKQAVLSQLFDTSRFKKLEEQLKKAADQMKSSIQQEENALNDLIQRFKSDKVIDKPLEVALVERTQELKASQLTLTEQAAELKALKTKLEEQFKELNKAKEIDQYFKELDQINEELTGLEAYKETHANNVIKLERMKKTRDLQDFYQLILTEKDNLNRTTEQLKELREEKVELNHQLSVTMEEQQTLKHQQDEIEQHQRYIQNFHHYSQAIEMKTIEQTITDNHASIARMEDRLKELEDAGDITMISSKIEQLQEQKNSNLIQSYPMERELADIDAQVTALEENNQKAAHKKQLNEEQQQDQQKLDLLLEETETEDEVVMAYRNNLEEGCECPVCLQKVTQLPPTMDMSSYRKRQETRRALELKIIKRAHQLETLEAVEVIDPAPLKERSGILNEQIKQLKQQDSTIDQQIKELKSTRTKLGEQLKEKEQLKEQHQKQKMELEALSSKWEQFKRETSFLHYDLFEADYQQRQQQVMSYDKRMKQVESAISKIQADLLKNETIATSKQDTVSGLNKKIESLNNKLEQRLAEYQIEESALEEDVQQQEIEELASSNERYQHQLSYAVTQQEKLSQLTEGLTRVDVEQLTAAYLHQKERLEQREKDYIILNENYKHNHALIEEINNRFSQFEDEHDKYKDTNRLYRLFGGKGDRGVTLESFVLRYYLEQTLIQSNIRLLQMTAHRYELRLRTEKKGNAKAGLDIEIFDYYSNDVRDISTLSGGETFLASLALALGLSDYVSQRAGGIHMESMFIDEGFGTLDYETLEVAISALIDLEQSGKMVGLISHVEMLKERIPAHLTVTSSGYTSQTKFVIK